MTSQAFIAAARSYIRTPWKHQGRTRSGVDCIGLVVLAGRDCGLDLPLEANYGRFQAYWAMKPILMQHADRAGSAEPGDIILFKSNALLHLAILTEKGTIVHAIGAAGRVTENRPMFPFLQAWRPRWHS